MTTSEIITTIGYSELARACGLTPTAVRKWAMNGLPRTEWTGETNYCHTIAGLAASLGIKTSVKQLLANRN